MCYDLKDSEALIAFAKRRCKNVSCYKIKYLPKFRVKYTWRLMLSLVLEQPSHLTAEEPELKIP